MVKKKVLKKSNLTAKVKLQTPQSLIKRLDNICKNDFYLFFIHFHVFLFEDFLQIFKMFTFEQFVVYNQVNEIESQIVHIVIFFYNRDFFINIIPLFLINSVFFVFQSLSSFFITIILRVELWFYFLFRVKGMRNFFRTNCILMFQNLLFLAFWGFLLTFCLLVLDLQPLIMLIFLYLRVFLLYFFYDLFVLLF